jgi:ATP-binding cassette, subfamily F, member 3
MLKVNQLSKAYGLDPILKKVSFSLNAGERAGLVGPNGSGKTTALRIIAGLESVDGGSVQLTPASLRLGYLAQGLTFETGDSIALYLERQQGDLPALSAEIERLAAALAESPDQPALQRAFDQALAQLSSAAGDPGRAPAVLAALGLDTLPPETPVAYLSGGQKTRLALAGVLLGDPQLLLLDEPTNHLDLGMLEWLEDWLNAYRGAVLIVSHDRAFLDRTVTRVLELDPATRQVREYAGSYADYVEAKLGEQERQWQAFTDQQAEILHLRNTARHLRGLAKFKRGGKADTGDKFAKGFFANRGKGTMGRATHIEERLTRLLTDERVDKPKAGWQMKLDFGEVPTTGQDVVVLEDLSVGYAGVALLTGLNQQIRAGARVALIGPNGSGKTTLLRTIAGRLPPLSGRARLGAKVHVGYMAQEQELLDPALDALGTVRAAAPLSETDARTFLHYFLFSGDDVFTPVGSLSFGERARLSLATLVARGCNFLLLDEPINHLDIPSRARFEQALAAFEGTVLAVVHDRYFIDSFASEVWEVKDGGVSIVW